MIKRLAVVLVAVLALVLWWVGGEVYDYFTMRRAFKYNVYAEKL